MRTSTMRSASRRSVALGVGSLVVVLGSLLAPPAAGAATDTERPEFPNGGAEAAASGVGLTISTGQADLGFNLGIGTANYQETTASARGQVFDVGALGTILTQQRCDFKEDPAINPATLPIDTIAETGMAESGTSRRAEIRYPSATDTLGAIVGYQDAVVTSANEAIGSTELANQDVGVFKVIGATTESHAWLDTAKKRRVATAVTRAKTVQIFGGVVTIREPVWTATAISGSEERLEATFDFKSATVAGQTRTRAQAAADIKAFTRFIEKLLTSFGAKFQWPTATIDPDSGTAKISPMALVMKDTPLGKYSIGPLLEQIDPLRKVLTAMALDEDCTNETIVTILDILTGFLAGTGTLTFSTGGATAATNDDWEPPVTFETTPTTAAPPTTAPPIVDSGGGSFVGDGFGGDFGSGFGTSDFGDGSLADLGSTDGLEEVAVEGTQVTAAPTTDEAPVEVAAATLPASLPEGKRGGAALVLGLLGLLGAIGLAVADSRTIRRGQRTIPAS